MLRSFRFTALRAVVVCGVVCGVLAVAHATETTYTYVRLSPTQYPHIIHDIFGPDIDVPANAVEPGVRDRGLLALGGRKLALSSAELERYDLRLDEYFESVRDIEQKFAAELERPAPLPACTIPDFADAESLGTHVERCGPRSGGLRRCSRTPWPAARHR